MRNINHVIQEQIKDTVEDIISDIPVNLKIDGIRIDPEENTGEIDRAGGEITIDMQFGLKDIIKRHPEEYREELHWPLFTDEEREEIINLATME